MFEQSRERQSSKPRGGELIEHLIRCGWHCDIDIAIAIDASSSPLEIGEEERKKRKIVCSPCKRGAVQL
jgi:hypothetical protein